MGVIAIHNEENTEMTVTLLQVEKEHEVMKHLILKYQTK